MEKRLQASDISDFERIIKDRVEESLYYHAAPLFPMVQSQDGI